MGKRKQELSKIIEHLSIDTKTKVVHYTMTILKEFFFEVKTKVWLKIKFKIFRHIEGATCQCQIGCGSNYNFILQEICLFQNENRIIDNMIVELV